MFCDVVIYCFSLVVLLFVDGFVVVCSLFRVACSLLAVYYCRCADCRCVLYVAYSCCSLPVLLVVVCWLLGDLCCSLSLCVASCLLFLACCSVFVARCWLIAVCCSLRVARVALLAVCCWLLLYSLIVARCSLLVVVARGCYCLLVVDCCLLFVDCCLLIVYCCAFIIPCCWLIVDCCLFFLCVVC